MIFSIFVVEKITSQLAFTQFNLNYRFLGWFQDKRGEGDTVAVLQHQAVGPKYDYK